MRFLSLYEAAVYFYKSNIWPCLKYYCHVWTGAFSCYVEILDKAQKWLCRAVGPYLAASLEPFANRKNVASLSHSVGITLVDAHLNWLNWLHFPNMVVRPLAFQIGCMIFLSPFLNVIRIFIPTTYEQFLSLQNALL